MFFLYRTILGGFRPLAAFKISNIGSLASYYNISANLLRNLKKYLDCIAKGCSTL